MKKLQLIQQRSGDWRWRFVCNGRIQATSGGDGYKNWKTCLRGYANIVGRYDSKKKIEAVFLVETSFVRVEVFSIPGNHRLSRKIAIKIYGYSVDRIKPPIRGLANTEAPHPVTEILKGVQGDRQ